MSFTSFVAQRYLFSKKSHNAINIIAGIAVSGIALATMAMVCTMSVFNGFKDLISGLYTTFDPQVLVTPTKGKYVATDDAVVVRMSHHPAVQAASTTITDNALILFRGRPLVVSIKGVDDKFRQVTAIDSIVFGTGAFTLERGGVDYGVPGLGLAGQMGGVDYGSLQICAPRGGERINLANPIESFSVAELQSPGVVFNVNQRKYDDHLILTSLSFAQSLFEKEGLATALELRLRPGSDTQQVKAELRSMGGDAFKVQDRLEQQAEIFSIMSIEKLIAYGFLTFIVLIACFNIISSLSMLIIEKRADVETMRCIGLSDKGVRRIFMLEGRMISLLGAVVGIILGVALSLAQEHFGLIRLGSGTGNFIVDAYPVSVHWSDLIIIFVTVIAVGYLAVWYPVSYLSRKLL